MYSCASASRATIKTVDFGYNTSTTLAGLFVKDIRPKVYSDSSKYPLWASETGKLPDWFLAAMLPLWGIVDKKDDSMQNIEYAQAPHLWLSSSTQLSGYGFITQNLPAGEFPGLGLFHAYGVNSAATISTSGVGDYSGRANLPMYNQWKNLSSTAAGSARILNLIWTDIAANAVVGTRNWIPTADAPNLSKRADAPSTGAQVPIHVLNRGTKYHIKYAIPAFLVLGLLLFALGSSVLAMILGRGTVGAIKMYLSRVSSGRLMTAIVDDDIAVDETVGVSSSNSMSTTKWLKREGTTVIDVSKRVPRAKGVERKYEAMEKMKAHPSQEHLYRDS
jgi:hypothetical protein